MPFMQKMPDWNRVLLGVFLGLPPTFFIGLHLDGGAVGTSPFPAKTKPIAPQSVSTLSAR